MLFDDRHDLGQFNGFGEIVVHASGEAAVAIAGHGEGGESDDGRALETGQGAQTAGGFEAVHLRHHHIHEDKLRAELLRLGDALETVASHEDLVAMTLEIIVDEHGDRLGILDQQDGGALIALWRGSGVATGLCSPMKGTGLNGYAPGDGYGETGPLAGLAFDTDGPTMQARHLADEDETEAGALGVAGEAGIELNEGLEEILDLVGMDADAGIPDGEVEDAVVSIAADLKTDASAGEKHIHGQSDGVSLWERH